MTAESKQGAGSATQVSALIWRLREFRFTPLGWQELLGYLQNVLKGLWLDLFYLEKKVQPAQSFGCAAPAAEGQRAAAFPEKSAEDGGGWPLPV